MLSVHTLLFVKLNQVVVDSCINQIVAVNIVQKQTVHYWQATRCKLAYAINMIVGVTRQWKVSLTH